MQKPAVARRTIVIELLRRLDQMEARRRRSRSTPATHRRFADLVQEDIRFKSTRFRWKSHWPSTPTTKPQFRLSKQDACLGATTSPVVTLNISDSSQGTDHNRPITPDASVLKTNQEPVWTGSVHSSTPRDVLHLTSTDVRELNRPSLQAERNEREASAAATADLTPPASPSKEAKMPDMKDGAHKSTIEPGGSQCTIARGTSRTVAPQLDDDLGSDRTPSLSDLESSGSDTTFCRSPTQLSDRVAADLEGDTMEGAQEDDFDSPDRTLVSTTKEVFSETNEPHISKNFSVESEVSTRWKASSAMLRARSKTNGGLLELRASATKPKDPIATRIHRRNVSINLPIRPIAFQPGRTRRFQPQSSVPSAPTPKPRTDETNTATQIEMELQYKHRHIFVGTASLYGFLELLETSTLGSTSKGAVMRAFTILASNEQLMARRSSTSPQDWNLITRITADISEFDYITLTRIQLGSVSLQQFIDSIPFNTHEEAPIVVVVEAFKNASHMDAEDGRNAGSKARAFRAWLLSQSGTVE